MVETKLNVLVYSIANIQRDSRLAMMRALAGFQARKMTVGLEGFLTIVLLNVILAMLLAKGLAGAFLPAG